MSSKPRFAAHTPNSLGEWQDLTTHLIEVAQLTKERASKFGAGDMGYRTGLLHDMGKFRPEFQDYILKCHVDPASAKRGEVVHSAFGCFFCEDDADILWPLIAGHHGGIYHYDDQKLRELKAKRQNEFASMPEQATAFLEQNDIQVSYPSEFSTSGKAEVLMRFLFSCLIDADSENTAQHEGNHIKLEYTSLLECNRHFQEKYHKAFANTDATKNINRIRQKIYADCVAKSSGQRDFYRITAPTGGGKTLASLAFALSHASCHSENNPVSRIIYVAPYTAIIDQTAKIYRKYLPPSAVLEHHSAVEPTDSEDQTALNSKRRQETERWESPFIVTTLVQLLESLFSNRRSKCRKVHNIANSVLIFDEAQCLPPHLLLPTLSLLNVLVEAFSCTIVFCTATQPALTALNNLLEKHNAFLPEMQEMSTDVPALFGEAKRVEYDFSLMENELTVEEVANAIRTQYDTAKRVLVIVNTKRLALELWNALKDLQPIHLSTLLHPKHRKRILAQIETGNYCVISTQVVEAGVDLDFPVVFREFGPLDRIVQAAGRCNRNGEPGQKPFGQVFLFAVQDARLPPGSYRVAVDASRVHLQQGVDLNANDPATYETYFRLFYGLLSEMGQSLEDRRAYFDFPEVAKQYKVINEETVPVLMWIEAQASTRVRKVLSAVEAKGFANTTDWRIIQQYCVSLRKDEMKKHLDPISLDEDWIPGLHCWRGYYHPQLGLGNTVQLAVEDTIA